MKGFQLTPGGNAVTLKVLGSIDETCEFPLDLKCAKIIVDFQDLTTMNSYGIRLWLIWTAKMSAIKAIELINCRPGFIRQIRHVSNLIPANGRVKSFYVRYVDPENETEVDVKLEYGKDFDEKRYTLPAPVNQAGKPLELDVDVRYFDFLKLPRA
jgi:hypothetical protein